jgi:hypothetical protein
MLVFDPEGLISAYLLALEVPQEGAMPEYRKCISSKFIQNFSVNVAHFNSSIYLIDKIINLKKID